MFQTCSPSLVYVEVPCSYPRAILPLLKPFSILIFLISSGRFDRFEQHIRLRRLDFRRIDAHSWGLDEFESRTSTNCAYIGCASRPRRAAFKRCRVAFVAHWSVHIQHAAIGRFGRRVRAFGDRWLHFGCKNASAHHLFVWTFHSPEPVCWLPQHCLPF